MIWCFSVYGKMQDSGLNEIIPLMGYLGPGLCFSPSWVLTGCTVVGGCRSWWPSGCNMLCLLIRPTTFFEHWAGKARLHEAGSSWDKSQEDLVTEWLVRLWAECGKGVKHYHCIRMSVPRQTRQVWETGSEENNAPRWEFCLPLPHPLGSEKNSMSWLRSFSLRDVLGIFINQPTTASHSTPIIGQWILHWQQEFQRPGHTNVWTSCLSIWIESIAQWRMAPEHGDTCDPLEAHRWTFCSNT